MDYEREFNKEIREKAIIARGMRARASRKKGIKGSVMTPVDYLSGKAKKEYMKNSKVVIYYMVNSWKEFLGLDKEKRKLTLPKLVEEAGGRKALAEKMGVSVTAIHSQFKELKLTKPIVKKNISASIDNTNRDLAINPLSDYDRILTGETTNNLYDPNLFRHTTSGQMTGKELSDYVTAIGMLVSSDKKYYASVQIVEIK